MEPKRKYVLYFHGELVWAGVDEWNYVYNLYWDIY